ncbi:MAG: AAA family ATPase [Candidatus Woesearchaeota archaeon]
MASERIVGHINTVNLPSGNLSLEEQNQILNQTVAQLQEQMSKFMEAPYLVAEVKDIHEGHLLIRLPHGPEFFVSSVANLDEIRSGDTVLVDQKSFTVLRKILLSKNFNVEQFVIMDKPSIEWKDIGGLKEQIQEIKEVIELPLNNPQLFEEVGIEPPKGILLHGPPGTGKTLLAKAVASSTNSTFIEVVGSELVQKFIGDGARLIKEIFQLAKEKSPSIIFIDELDAIASKRMDIGTSGEREVQRTFMQLLAEVDGFKSLGNVKIIGCTNRKDILDPAVIRPGRLDRLIHVPAPDEEGLAEIFKIHSRRMKLDPEINLSLLVSSMDSFSGAEIRSVCTEAGYFAIRENKKGISEQNLIEAIAKVRQEEKEELNSFFG